MNSPKPQTAKGPGNAVTTGKPAPGTGLVQLFAARYHVEAGSLLNTLRNTAFSVTRGDPMVTNEEMMALLVVANQYHLNPFTKEIYAFRNKAGGITPIIGFDGWIRLVQNQETYNGEELVMGYDETKVGESDQPFGMYYECKMYRKDRAIPTTVREYLRENHRNTDPWNRMPNRMLRMRAYIQCARVCFGFGGIYDEDEGEKIALSPGVDLLPATPQGAPAAPQARTDAPRQLANDEHLDLIIEKLAKTGVSDNLVLAKFEVGDFKEIPADRVADVLDFIQANAP